MPTVFESISDGYYQAFSHPDAEKRKEAIEMWIQESIPIIQSAVENELRIHMNGILEGSGDSKNWKARAQKYYDLSQAGTRDAFIEKYRLYLDIGIRPRRTGDRDKETIVGALTPDILAKTSESIESVKWAIAKLEPPDPIDLREIDLHEKYANEAIPIVEKFLIECYRDKVRRIRIIHGKGIFVLQKAVREYLKTNELVEAESISSAVKDHGGEGATEANLIELSLNE